MLFSTLFVIVAAAPLPRECEPPPLREVAPIKELANLDGAFSAGLDAVATWCFDSAGNWNAGQLGKPKKPIPVDALPTGDCLKAIASCEGTNETVTNKAPLRELSTNALADFDRPYRNAKYVPKRSGLKEVPSQIANCRSKSRTELFAMAQQRMDLARLTSQVLNEYANYKTWLFSKGIDCKNEVAAAPKKDATKTGLSIDSNVDATPALSAKDPETVAALKLPMVDKWKFFSKQQAKVEADRDYTLGFLASRELRGCDCTRVNPAAVVRALENKTGEAGIALLTSEDPNNTRCAVCMFEVFPLWSARAQKQCSSLDALSDADLAKLEKSDDANGLPPRCLEETKATRGAKAALMSPTVSLATAPGSKPGTPGGPVTPSAPATTPGTVGASGTAAAPVKPGVSIDAGTKPALAGTPATAAPNIAATGGAVAAAPATDAGSNPHLQTVDGYTYYRPPTAGTPNTATVPSTGGTTAAVAPKPVDAGMPVAAAAALTGPGIPTGPLGYVAPATWAPIPQREDGRIYVRLFMSASCIADVEPGPLQARTGDLLLLPFEAKALQVKSPCGGLAEVYFGREARPRVSENFGSNKPLKFEFKRQ